jgi:sodium-coupled neutral amino acid transporter 11
MLSWSGRQNGQISGDGQPLLQSSHEHEDSENTLFAVEDDDDVSETSALERPHPRSKADHSVHFQDQVQVIAPPLRSTTESRETGMSSVFVLVSSLSLQLEYELDSDDIDDEIQSTLEHGTRRGNRPGEQSMPLLVGLLDASVIRRSLDTPMGMDGISVDVDLDELAAKQSSGGGILNSIANMANAILGAGACFAYFQFL